MRPEDSENFLAEECRREAFVQEMRKLAVENEKLKQKYATLLLENENKSTLEK